MTPKPDAIKAGQESVWSYPRPPIAEASTAHIVIVHAGVVIADTCRAVRTLETSHPPTYYIPQLDIHPGMLRRAEGSSYCEWKGNAVYWDVVADGFALLKAGWCYPKPNHAFEALTDHVAFYAGPFDHCSVNGEAVTPQPGGFYGGWITAQLAGPFKGVPGSRFW